MAQLNMDPKTAYDALKQIWDGDDIPAPKSLLSRMKGVDAAKKPPGAPYSLLTNLAHADFWNRIWLPRLKDEPRPNMLKDWRVPPPEEFEAVRASFLASIEEAMKIADKKPFKHKMKSDESAIKTLNAIAIHTAYHLGQMKLLKRTTSGKD